MSCIEVSSLGVHERTGGYFGSVSDSGNSHVLPDSRCKDPTGTFMATWTSPYGEVVRTEWTPIYCANCGKPYGSVTGPITFAMWLCNHCFETWGHIPGTWVMPDDEFNLRVSEEVIRKYGRLLTPDELVVEEGNNNLSPELQALVKDSPYRRFLP
jgi:hypothetical protein